jgi:hypothetical protein
MHKTLLLLALCSLFCISADAQSYSTLGAGCNEKVYAITGGQPGSGVIYAGGAFVNAGGSPVNYIAMWDGTDWNDLDNGVNFQVRSLMYQGGDLYVGGGFNLAGSGSTVAWSVARWDGASWSGLGNGIRGGEVYALEMYGNNLYAGGMFDTLSGFNPGRGIQMWDGSSWLTLGGSPGDGVSGPPGFKVKALKTFNGELYVGGSFDMAGGVSASNIAKWDGTSWSAIGSGTNGEVNSIEVFNNELYIGGDFTDAGGVTVNGIAKLTGSTFTALGSGTNGKVNAIAAYMNKMYVTGAFTTAGSVTTQNIAAWDGTTWSAVGLGLNFDGYTLEQYTGDLYIGGFFSVAGTAFANNIALYNIPVGLSEANISGIISVGPVPANDEVFVLIKEDIRSLSLSILDLHGRIVFERSAYALSAGATIPLDVSDFSSGRYNLVLTTPDGVYVTGIVVN